MSFNICIHLCDHQQNQDIEHFFASEKSSRTFADHALLLTPALVNY